MVRKQQALDRVQQVHGASEDEDLVRQMLVTAMRLVQDGTSARDLKLLNSALKELRHAFRVFSPYIHQRKVAVAIKRSRKIALMPYTTIAAH